METGKYYVIENNVVINHIVCTEQYAAQNNLIRSPVNTSFGIVDTNWTYIDGTFLPPPRDILVEWSEILSKVSALYSESNDYVMPDRWASYSLEKQQAWAKYREDLRTIKERFIDPKEVVFPIKPE